MGVAVFLMIVVCIAAVCICLYLIFKKEEGEDEEHEEKQTVLVKADPRCKLYKDAVRKSLLIDLGAIYAMAKIKEAERQAKKQW